MQLLLCIPHSCILQPATLTRYAIFLHLVICNPYSLSFILANCIMQPLLCMVYPMYILASCKLQPFLSILHSYILQLASLTLYPTFLLLASCDPCSLSYILAFATCKPCSLYDILAYYNLQPLYSLTYILASYSSMQPSFLSAGNDSCSKTFLTFHGT